MVARAHCGANAWFRVLMRERASIAADGVPARPVYSPDPMDAEGRSGEHRHTGVEAKEADVSAISSALLGLATGWVVELVHEDEFTRWRRVCVFALAAGGALLGGMLGAALALGSFSLIRFGSWHTAIGGAAGLLWIHGAGARAVAATTTGPEAQR
jgi:hypothetical protein